ncbi:hypothetical protein [Candidatus Halobonum tyrrellensis]|uniref:Uncharacterized protein n=1 Tax=Candidatus Halobonum tyrrellensis G22 TaxID=1324957 RepID=V4HPW7_9EURY|nr:hypothetical protein [Candidatus Halobonum tyrrellensis]ESP89959.1 hypothetical protein K933_00312 [Candidatus Halobonum tyrrellensis G22]
MAPDSPDADDGRTDGRTLQYTTDAWTAESFVDDANAYVGHPPESESEGDGGLLRVGFRDDDEDLTEVSGEEFREEFDEKGLALVRSPDGSGVEGDRPLALVERSEVSEEADADAFEAGAELVDVDEARE